MPVITKVLLKQGKEQSRIYVYVDGGYCTSIRERTWIGMGLAVGSKISCAELKKLECNFWKELYGPNSWKREKVRIERITQWFSAYIPQVEIIRIGLGSDSNDYLENMHSEEKGSPDLSVRVRNTSTEIIALEISGTERMQGDDYWVRKDKIDYIQRHPDRDIWIALHYQVPKEKFVWIKIVYNKPYPTAIKNIKGADEYYVMFNKDAEEIKSSVCFKDYMLAKLSY